MIKNFFKRQWVKIGMIIVPLILFFANTNIVKWNDKARYFVDIIVKSTPFLFLYALWLQWYDNNKVFALSISSALLLNLIVGIRYHWKRGTFNIGVMLRKEIEMLLVVVFVYILLRALANPLLDSFAGTIFIGTIEFISVLYPVSKALKNIFIITDGKHPPKFVIQALYNYEKEGKLKDFFDSFQNGTKSEEQDKGTEKQQEDEEIKTEN